MAACSPVCVPGGRTKLRLKIKTCFFLNEKLVDQWVGTAFVTVVIEGVVVTSCLIVVIKGDVVTACLIVVIKGDVVTACLIVIIRQPV